MSVEKVSWLEMRASIGFAQTVGEYMEEFAEDAPGAPAPNLSAYEVAEDAGELVCLGSYDEGVLVGGCLLSVRYSPHYGKPIVTVEALFLRKKFRQGARGYRLLRRAEEEAKALGAPGLCLSAAPGTALDRLCAVTGWVEARKVYFKPFGGKNE